MLHDQHRAQDSQDAANKPNRQSLRQEHARHFDQPEHDIRDQRYNRLG